MFVEYMNGLRLTLITVVDLRSLVSPGDMEEMFVVAKQSCRQSLQ